MIDDCLPEGLGQATVASVMAWLRDDAPPDYAQESDELICLRILLAWNSNNDEPAHLSPKPEVAQTAFEHYMCQVSEHLETKEGFERFAAVLFSDALKSAPEVRGIVDLFAQKVVTEERRASLVDIPCDDELHCRCNRAPLPYTFLRLRKPGDRYRNGRTLGYGNHHICALLLEHMDWPASVYSFENSRGDNMLLHILDYEPRFFFDLGPSEGEIELSLLLMEQMTFPQLCATNDAGTVALGAAATLAAFHMRINPIRDRVVGPLAKRYLAEIRNADHAELQERGPALRAALMGLDGDKQEFVGDVIAELEVRSGEEEC